VCITPDFEDDFDASSLLDTIPNGNTKLIIGHRAFVESSKNSELNLELKDCKATTYNESPLKHLIVGPKAQIDKLILFIRKSPDLLFSNFFPFLFISKETTVEKFQEFDKIVDKNFGFCQFFEKKIQLFTSTPKYVPQLEVEKNKFLEFRPSAVRTVPKGAISIKVTMLNNDDIDINKLKTKINAFSIINAPIKTNRFTILIKKWYIKRLITWFNMMLEKNIVFFLKTMSYEENQNERKKKNKNKKQKK
jgi:hypothetical protein